MGQFDNHMELKMSLYVGGIVDLVGVGMVAWELSLVGGGGVVPCMVVLGFDM